MFNNNLLMGAAAATSGASLVSVDNSALFNGTNYLARTPSSTGVEEKGTLSRWIYRTTPGNQDSVFAAYISATQLFQIYFPTDDTLHVYNYSGGYDWQLATTQVFRDIGWIHIVVAIDTTQAVEDDRAIIYINGERVTALATANYPSLNFVNDFNTSSVVNNLGPYDGASGNGGLEGYAAETVWIDGLQLTPFSFGEYDSSGLYWTPKSSDDIKTLTFGTNGFYLDNTTNAQTDASGQGNNFSNNGSVTTNVHTPTNMYALLNPLMSGSTGTFSEGNRRSTIPPTNTAVISNLPVGGAGVSGKWYCEFQFNTIVGYAVVGVGIMDQSSWLGNTAYYESSTPQFAEEGSLFTEGTTSGSSITVSASTTYGLMWDEDNSILKITDGTNTWQCTYTVNDTSIPIGFIFAVSSGSGTGDVSVNFGSPPFSISSGNADANGYGDFEFAVPSGYLALNTANIASRTTRTASDTNKYFQTVLYEGNGTQQRVGNFQPFTDSFTVSKGALFPATGNLSRTFDEAGNRQIFSLSTWFKIGQTGEQEGSVGVTLFSTKNGSANSESTWFVVKLNTSNQLVVSIWNDLITTRTFEDTSQWYHLLLAVDTTQGTTADRIKVYINGVQETSFGTANYPSSSASLAWGVDSTAHYVGVHNDGSNYEWNGYLAQTAYITGTQLTPSSFGQTDTSSNRWIPKDISGLTFGSAGFFLDYADSGNVGDDESGNTNDFTNNNTVVQSGDTPTVNWNIIFNTAFSGGTLSNGNRSLITGSSQYGPALGSLGIDSGKWYWEIKPTASSTAQLYSLIGISRGINLSTSNNLGYQVGDYGYYSLDGDIVTNNNGAGESYGVSYAVDDIIGVALDLDDKTITFYKNNSTQGIIKGLLDGMYYAAMGDWNNSGTTSFEARFDSSMWSYSAPTDHIALSQDNIASSSQFISAFSWIKNRDATDNHMLFDRVRGATKDLHSNSTAVEVTNLETVQRFLAGGVQVGNDVEVNTANESYALWNFMIEATGSGSSLTGGDINTTALVDTTLGMAVGTYSGSNSNQTIETGLTNPTMVMIKRLNATYNWAIWHEGLTDDYNLFLNTNAAQVDSDYFDTSQNTSTLFYLLGNSNATSISGGNFVYMAFANSQFISIGTYEGNGNANGTFVPTLNSLGVPIQPVWVLLKSMDHTQSWWIRDTARNPYNVVNKELYPDLTNAEATSASMDIVTGGIKQRVSSDSNSSYTYIYMAIGTPIIDTDGRIIAGR
jgi:hypothetical protein